MATYLDFENKIEKIQEEIISAHAIANMNAVEKHQEELAKEVQKTFGSLSDFQKLQLARHPDRPYSLDYIRALMTDAYEIHGDRAFRDDPAILCYIGWIDGQKTMVIGEQKGRGVKNKIKRNFGMPNPEGYRKALRAVRLAEKFDIPVLMLIDTPGAYPGLEAEERGQGEAIARNIFEMINLKVPVICIIIGEGASGGALGIGIGDRVLMLENTWYSVISPESCSSILWRSWDYKEKAAASLKLTANDMLKNKLVDGIIQEPFGGAHTDQNKMFRIVKKEIQKLLEELSKIDVEKRIDLRCEKFCDMGVIKK